MLWKHWIEIIRYNGGYVHPYLEIRDCNNNNHNQNHNRNNNSNNDINNDSSNISNDNNKNDGSISDNNNNDLNHYDDNDYNDNNRGLYTKDIIYPNELLIKIPIHMTIHGKYMSSTYHMNNNNNKNMMNDSSCVTNDNNSTDTTGDSVTVASINISKKHVVEDNIDNNNINTDDEDDSNNKNKNNYSDTVLVQRYASPWLRCLASYYNAYYEYYCYYHNKEEKLLESHQATAVRQHHYDHHHKTKKIKRQQDIIDEQSITKSTITTNNYKLSSHDNYYYIESLPKYYETLWLSWDYTNEINVYLSGSCNINYNTNHESSTSRERYDNQIKPYLIQHCHNGMFTSSSSTLLWSTSSSSIQTTDNDNEIKFFHTVCQILSTRCFHLETLSTTKIQQQCHQMNNDNNIDDNNQPQENDNDMVGICQSASDFMIPTTTSNSTSLFKQKSQNQKLSSSSSSSLITKYDGPFLIPIMDLINHTSDRQLKCTTLQRIDDDDGNIVIHNVDANNVKRTNNNNENNDGCFIMISERLTQPNEEILHSYGYHLNSFQFLQTFGFIPETYINRAVYQLLVSSSSSSSIDKATTTSNHHHTTTTTTTDDNHNDINDYPITPIIINKYEIFKTCWDIINSDIPNQIMESIQKQQTIDDCEENDDNDEINDDDDVIETWMLSVDRSRLDMMDYISDDIVISLSHNDDDHDVNHHNLITDEMITLFCIPFLPEEALLELVEDQSIVDKSILDDIYLGKLVYHSMERFIHNQLLKYIPISETIIQQLLLRNDDDKHIDEESSLLLNNNKIDDDSDINCQRLRTNDTTEKIIVRDDHPCMINDRTLLQRILLQMKDHVIVPCNDNGAEHQHTIRTKRKRLSYGLTIRLEEKYHWMMLQHEINAVMFQ